MKKVFAIVSILFFININGSAQLRHGLHVMAGMSKIQSLSVVVYPEPTVSEVLNNFDFAWTVGYEGSLARDNGFALQFGLDALLLKSKTSQSVYTNDSDFVNFDSEMSAAYLSIPLLAGFKIDNIAILTGLRTSFFLRGSREGISEGKEDGIVIMNSFSDDLIQLDEVDLGHHTELNYGLGENLEVVLSYYYGFGAYANEPKQGNYYQQLSIGLAYLFN